MAAVESRAFALRMNVGDVCRAANIHPSVWSRAKTRGTIRPRLLARMEETLAALERQRAGDDQQTDQAAA